MKKKHEFLKDKKSIVSWLKKHNISNYYIKEDKYYHYTVEVFTDVDLAKKSLEFIPIKFSFVRGFFDCSHNNLSTLLGSPDKVGEDFYCINNNLTSLFAGPSSVSGQFICSHNKIENLDYLPHHIGKCICLKHNKLDNLKGFDIECVNGNFDISHNKIISLENSPKYVNGVFNCAQNKIKNIIGAPQIIGLHFEATCNEIESIYSHELPQILKGKIFLNQNPKLKALQTIRSYQALKQLLSSYEEKSKINISISNVDNLGHVVKI